MKVIQVGEVIAILLGLTHGLGQTQDLLRNSEVAKSSQVRQFYLLIIKSCLIPYLGCFRRLDTVPFVILLGQMLDLDTYDETLQSQRISITKFTSIKIDARSLHIHSRSHGCLGCSGYNRSQCEMHPFYPHLGTEQ